MRHIISDRSAPRRFSSRTFPLSLVSAWPDNSHGSDQCFRVKKKSPREELNEPKEKKRINTESTCVNGVFSEERSTAYSRFAFSRVRPSSGSMSTRGILPVGGTRDVWPPRTRARQGLPSPMDIAQSSRTINPFLAFYVLNVPRARRSP